MEYNFPKNGKIGLQNGPFNVQTEDKKEAIYDNRKFNPIQSLELRRLLSQPSTLTITIDRDKTDKKFLKFVGIHRKSKKMVWIVVSNIYRVNMYLEWPYIIFGFEDCNGHIMGDPEFCARLCSRFDKNLYSSFRADGTMLYEDMPKEVDFLSVEEEICSTDVDCREYSIYLDTFTICNADEIILI